MKKHLKLVMSLGTALLLLLAGCITIPSETTENRTVEARRLPEIAVVPGNITEKGHPAVSSIVTENETLVKGQPSAVLAGIAANQTAELRFSSSGYTTFGDWYTDIVVSPVVWQPGSSLNITATLRVTEDQLLLLSQSKIRADGFAILVTAERTFDAEGWLRLSSDERMSTILTPTGLAVEGGVQGAVTNRFGFYDFRTPVDEFLTQPLRLTRKLPGEREATFTMQARLPDDLPPGIYRLRLDYGVTVGTRYYNLNGEAFARRPFFQGRPTESHLYSPPIRASGRHADGHWVDAATIQPRIPWVLLRDYNSNGYRGVIAGEDQPHFALADRNLIHDDVILPLYDASDKNRLAYSLEPQFPADTIEARSAIPWDYTKGELSLQITGPDGKTADLGTAPFVGLRGQWPTTKKPAFTSWKPTAYGQYTVRATGWIADIWGNRYEGGGTYRFWIAKRMTLATATFQGMPYPVGSRYGRDIAFAPAVPADVEVSATLYVNSDPNNKQTITYKGKANRAGVFGAAQGLLPFPLNAPGEYYAYILARYTDKDGHLWVSSMRHAGVVYPEDSPIVARGKKLAVGNKLVDRGDTYFEGYVDIENVTYLAHINYTVQSGDVLLIASEQQGANKIEPVLTYEPRVNPPPYDSRLQTIGATNLKLRTSNGYSPHLFPEYITDWAYYYGASPRPAYMGRFLVGEDGVRAPYWPTSANNFGGQIGASNNGDMPGEIYRLIGGVVLRKKGEAAAYAGYIASCSILPPETKNNRIIAAGSESLLGATGQKERFFLVGLRPGMVYEAGTTLVPVAQIDPIIPATVRFVLYYPDGRRVVAEGTGDRFGSWAGKERWVLDVPGVYRYTLEGEWEGSKGYMPGLPRNGGEFYVVEGQRLANAPELKLNLPPTSTFAPAKGITISGTTTAETVYFAALTPGAVLEQGTLSVIGGKFQYYFNPTALNQVAPVYDVVNFRTGQPEIKDVVHLTFFARERTTEGQSYHTFVRIIIRGNTVLYTR